MDFLPDRRNTLSTNNTNSFQESNRQSIQELSRRLQKPFGMRCFILLLAVAVATSLSSAVQLDLKRCEERLASFRPLKKLTRLDSTGMGFSRPQGRLLPEARVFSATYNNCRWTGSVGAVVPDEYDLLHTAQYDVGTFTTVLEPDGGKQACLFNVSSVPYAVPYGRGPRRTTVPYYGRFSTVRLRYGQYIIKLQAN